MLHRTETGRDQGGYRCNLKKCTTYTRLYPTKNELHDHITNFHMPHTRALPCPIRGCRKGPPFSLPTQLISQFRTSHVDLEGHQVDRTSDLFLQSWMPFHVSNLPSPPPPPPLPHRAAFGTVLVPVADGQRTKARRSHKRRMPQTHILGQLM